LGGTATVHPIKALPARPFFGNFAGMNSKRIAIAGGGAAGFFAALAYCGARRSEALRLKWSDVDFDRKQLTIGSDGMSKNHKARVVDFNSKLEAHLEEMKSRRAPDTEWLFPSPQRGNKDIPAKSFRETLLLARTAAWLPKFGFHDLRHYFIS
jgi:integrase